MERELPIYEIHRTKFLVDVKANELRQQDNHRNKISFSEMRYEETYYEFKYDRIKKSKADFLSDGPRDVAKVAIPQKTELDPSGMAERYGLKVEEIKGKSDFEIMVDQEKYRLRAAGVLPIVHIAGHPFFVDLRLRELRPKDDLLNNIKLDRLDVNKNDNYEFFYKPSTRQVVEIKLNIKTLPKGVFLVEVPKDTVLDPYGVAKIYGVNEKDWLINHPIKSELSAKTTPIEKTPVKDLIKKNKEQGLLKKNRKGPDNKKGKHL